MPTDNQLGYAGAWRSPITGAYPLGNGYRAYLPGLMRFAAPDSASPFDGGGMNPYAYGAGDPVNHLDPSGHIPITNALDRIAASSRGVEENAMIADRSVVRRNLRSEPSLDLGRTNTRRDLRSPLIPRLHISVDKTPAVGYSSISLTGYGHRSDWNERDADSAEFHFPAPISLKAGKTTVAELPDVSIIPPHSREGSADLRGIRGHQLFLSFELASRIGVRPRNMNVAVRFETNWRALYDRHTFKIDQIAPVGDESIVPTLRTSFNTMFTPYPRYARYFDIYFDITDVIPPMDNYNIVRLILARQG